MRSAVLGSTGVHLVILAVLLVTRQAAPVLVPGPDVVQVALLDTPPSAAVPKVVTPPEPKPDIKQPEIKPTDEAGVKLIKPKPKPAPKQPETKSPTPSTEVTALPYASVGSSGLRGQVAVDAKDFEFTYWLVLVRNKIAANWSPPGGLAAGQGPRAVVYFRVGRDGYLRGAPQLETASGVDFFDRSALRAVLVSDPLPPLPFGFVGGDLGVHFGFEYAGP